MLGRCDQEAFNAGLAQPRKTISLPRSRLFAVYQRQLLLLHLRTVISCQRLTLIPRTAHLRPKMIILFAPPLFSLFFIFVAC